MNYGQALEAMKQGKPARRSAGGYVYLAHRGTPMQYLEAVQAGEGRSPYNPTIDDQLADDWQVPQAPVKEAA